jgi:hypothetical protein
MNNLPFVFCIGFNKCGTTSLFNFFRGNGFPSVHNAGGRLALQMLTNCVKRQPIFAGFDQKYRCFSDMEYVNDRIAVEGNWYFRLMDRDYPNSYFIYNTRSMDKWLSSRSRWIGPSGSYLERCKKMLNTTRDDVVVEYWRASRLRFEAEMFTYFENRKDLLVLDIEEPRCPERIAAFLGRDLDAGKWGWENKSPADPALSQPGPA